MTTCPNCKREHPDGAYRCQSCNYGFAVRPQGRQRKPRFLGDSQTVTRDEELARTYRCPSCRSYGGRFKRIATTGAGLSRVFDLQLNEFLVVSCSFCGQVQMYDADIIDSRSCGWIALDFLFG